MDEVELPGLEKGRPLPETTHPSQYSYVSVSATWDEVGCYHLRCVTQSRETKALRTHYLGRFEGAGSGLTGQATALGEAVNEVQYRVRTYGRVD